MEKVNIKGFEDYQITDDGRVWSKKSNKWMKTFKSSNGYKHLSLCKNGVMHWKQVHKLVAEHFIPNPENKLEVDHINTDRTDNRVENLRWVTHKENCNNPISIEHYKNMIPVKGMLGKHHTEETKKKMSEANKGKTPWIKGKHLSEEAKKKISKKVYQYTLDGKLEKIWSSTAECGRNGYNQGNVVSCCNGTLKKYKNKIFSYFLL